MNTKQIWQALTCNTKTEPYFDGVFPINELKNIIDKPELIICNTDPSNKPGQHLVLFFFHNDIVDFFDSLGKNMEYYGEEFVNFAKRFSSKFQISLMRTQPKNISLCACTLHTKGVLVKKWIILLSLWSLLIMFYAL